MSLNLMLMAIYMVHNLNYHHIMIFNVKHLIMQLHHHPNIYTHLNHNLNPFYITNNLLEALKV